MKKFLALILALTMVMSLGAVAFAADPQVEKDLVADTASDSFNAEATEEITVDIKLENNVNIHNMYRVAIKWDSTTFTYELTGDVHWDTKVHQYKNGVSGDAGAAPQAAWKDGNSSADITVSNHSDLPVKIKATYEPASASEITGEPTFKYTNGSDNGEYTSNTDKTLEKCPVSEAGDDSDITVPTGVFNVSVANCKPSTDLTFESDKTTSVKIGTITIHVEKVS